VTVPWGAIYGALAAIVAVGTWSTRAHPLSLAMLAAWILSTAAHNYAPVMARPVAYALVDVILVSFVFWMMLRGYIPAWAAVGMIALSVVAVAADCAFWLVGQPTSIRMTWGVAVNVVFALQVLLSLGWGLTDELRFDFGRAGSPFRIGVHRSSLERGGSAVGSPAQEAPQMKGPDPWP
jgi:hypothetical protein